MGACAIIHYLPSRLYVEEMLGGSVSVRDLSLRGQVVGGYLNVECALLRKVSILYVFCTFATRWRDLSHTSVLRTLTGDSELARVSGEMLIPHDNRNEFTTIRQGESCLGYHALRGMCKGFEGCSQDTRAPLCSDVYLTGVRYSGGSILQSNSPRTRSSCSDLRYGD